MSRGWWPRAGLPAGGRSSSAAQASISARWPTAYLRCPRFRKACASAGAGGWESGPQELHRILERDDAQAARLLKPGDGQRILRALEVLEASGRSILAWQKDGGGLPLIDRNSARFIVIEPERPLLVERIGQRFARMVEQGAIDEVKALLALKLDAQLPAMKAIGVRELGMVIEGRIPLAEAVLLAAIATRQYAKRQATWFRNQLGPEWQRLTASFI